MHCIQERKKKHQDVQGSWGAADVDSQWKCLSPKSGFRNVHDGIVLAEETDESDGI